MSFTPRPARRADDDLGDVTDMVAADPLEESTALMALAEVARAVHRSLPTPPGMMPVPESPRSARLARGSSSELGDKTAPHPIRRATTQNTIARSSIEDTAPNPIVIEDTRPHPAPIMVPAKRMLGGYRITGTLASGQMGVVYRGEHPSAKKPPVAIKAVHGQLQTNPAIAARFFAESIVLARIVHPNVVRFHDFGYDASGSAYLVMELLEGETLSGRLARERQLDIAVATDIAMQVTQGLAAAHAQGIVHRDIKPDNVFLCRDGRVKLLDFGIAKIEGQGPTHTLQGDLLGTAAYMAPEQGRSASESDGRSDLYSIGCLLFEMVCGIVPFPGSLVETLVAHQTAQRPPARALNPQVSGGLDTLIDRLLSRDPADRPQTAVDVIRALGALESTTQRPLRPAPRSKTFIAARPFQSQLVRVARAPVTLGVLATLLGLVLSLLLLR
jgi:serine/threonine-protein kinase